VEESNLYSIKLHAGIPNQLPSTQPHFPKNFRFEIEDCRLKQVIQSKIQNPKSKIKSAPYSGVEPDTPSLGKIGLHPAGKGKM
jgi:hypothetical protein